MPGRGASSALLADARASGLSGRVSGPSARRFTRVRGSGPGWALQAGFERGLNRGRGLSPKAVGARVSAPTPPLPCSGQAAQEHVAWRCKARAIFASYCIDRARAFSHHKA